MKSEIQTIPPKSPNAVLTWLFPLVFSCLIVLFILLFLPQNNAQATDSAFGIQSQGMAGRPQILLPGGYAINGRSAILVKHPSENRWFLKFKLSIKTVKPSSKRSSDSNQQLLGTGKPPNNAKPQKKQENQLHSKLDPFAIPFEVLPCQWLTKMTSVSGDLESGSINFRVWAEVTTYHQRNYILPTHIYLLSLFGKAALQAKSKAVNGLSQLDLLQPDSGLSDPSEKRNDRKPRDNGDLEQSKTIDALRNMLLSLPRAQPLTLTDDDSQDAQSNQGQQALTPSPIRKSLQKNNKAGTASKLSNGRGDSSRSRGSFPLGGKTRSDLKEGAMIVDRVGRLVYDPDERMWMFTFESDASHLTEAPIALLPCQLLEVMEKRTYQSTRRVKFRISGRVTKYQNRYYLLLRKVLLVFEQGNIGK